MNAQEQAAAPCASTSLGEHIFEERGFATMGPDSLCGVWWWECACGLFVWHQRGNLERGILAGHFVKKEDAPKEFDLNA